MSRTKNFKTRYHHCNRVEPTATYNAEEVSWRQHDEVKDLLTCVATIRVE